MTFFKSGEKPRAHYRLPQGSFIQTDQWMDCLGYEQYCWWLKFHSWVDRTPKRFTDNHVPYTLEKVFEKLNVSQATFYRKIKVLWECGLVEIVEFESSEKKGQKPKNIIVYEYPFNNAEFEYKPLEKLRDWKKDYESQSKIAGIKGGLIRRLSTNPDHPLNSERVKKPVDNHPLKIERVKNSEGDLYPLNSERVKNSVDNHPLNSERVKKPVDNYPIYTLSELRANKDTNINIKDLNKEREYNKHLLSLSLTNITVEELKNILTDFTFSEGECDKVIELVLQHKLFDISKQEIIKQAQYMLNRSGIRSRPIYFVKGVETNLDRIYPTKKLEGSENEKESEFRGKVRFYNWLEE